MATTSINVQPIKGGSELHNTRAKDLDYVRPELSHLNESWQIDSVQNRLESIKENYQKTTGQTMQKKATPIREGVVVIGKDTTMKDLQDFARSAEDRFGIKTIQIHIHRDEGHQGAKEFKSNLHAHMVFDWTQPNGKSCKLNKQDMAELQTLLSLSLKMDRGQSSDVKHLSAVQYKNNREKEKLEKLQKEVKSTEIKKSIKETTNNGIKAISKGFEKTKDFFGATTNDKEKNRLESENKALKEALSKEQASRAVDKVSLSNAEFSSSHNEKRAVKAEKEVRELKSELKEMAKNFTPEMIQNAKERYPKVMAEMEKAHIQKQERSQSRGMGR